MAAIQQNADIKDVDVLKYGTYMVLGSNELKKTKKTADALGNIGKVLLTLLVLGREMGLQPSPCTSIGPDGMNSMYPLELPLWR